MKANFKRYLYNLNTEVLKATADDFRKVGTYALGLSIAGWILDSDSMVSTEAYWLFTFGLLIWNFGILCTYLADKLKQWEN
ncbi:hypothetical protein [Conservatibacter flavescens]|uniref:Uncharacterized protein n=1 Tax=Conservatibacter flavescens TaxID=28161 RepID=A0A2M8S0Z1_9PAST|nr:hypothetical protein [Conservatibacter flavescens]PJG84823.1 hypothetical protein CVP05_09815 [Conservatibacter flavescens]